jgi:NADPH-dependent curcumin reductase CurA
MGCRVIGIAGGAEKCAYAVASLVFDACIDHKSEGFAAQLLAEAPKGIDVYFENVGGAVFDAVLPLLNTGARVPVCGLISQYNATGLPDGPDRLSMLMGQVLRKRLTVRGFIIFQDFGHLYPEFAKAMGAWLAAGKMHYVEDMVEGLEAAPRAFIGLLRGENFGKLVIHVGPGLMIENKEGVL